MDSAIYTTYTTQMRAPSNLAAALRIERSESRRSGGAATRMSAHSRAFFLKVRSEVAMNAARSQISPVANAARWVPARQGFLVGSAAEARKCDGGKLLRNYNLSVQMSDIYVR